MAHSGRRGTGRCLTVAMASGPHTAWLPLKKEPADGRGRIPHANAHTADHWTKERVLKVAAVFKNGDARADLVARLVTEGSIPLKTYTLEDRLAVLNGLARARVCGQQAAFDALVSSPHAMQVRFMKSKHALARAVAAASSMRLQLHGHYSTAYEKHVVRPFCEGVARAADETTSVADPSPTAAPCRAPHSSPSPPPADKESVYDVYAGMALQCAQRMGVLNDCARGSPAHGGTAPPPRATGNGAPDKHTLETAAVMLFSSAAGTVHVGADAVDCAAAVVVRGFAGIAAADRRWVVWGMARHARPEIVAIAEMLLLADATAAASSPHDDDPRTVALVLAGVVAHSRGVPASEPATREALIRLAERLLALYRTQCDRGRRSNVARWTPATEADDCGPVPILLDRWQYATADSGDTASLPRDVTTASRPMENRSRSGVQVEHEVEAVTTSTPHPTTGALPSADEWAAILEGLANTNPLLVPPGHPVLADVCYELAEAVEHDTQWGMTGPSTPSSTGRGPNRQTDPSRKKAFTHGIARVCRAAHTLRHTSTRLAMAIEQRVLVLARAVDRPTRVFTYLHHTAAVMRWFAACNYPGALAIRVDARGGVHRKDKLAVSRQSRVWREVLIPGLLDIADDAKGRRALDTTGIDELMVVVQALQESRLAPTLFMDAVVRRLRASSMDGPSNFWKLSPGMHTVEAQVKVVEHLATPPHAALDGLNWLVDRRVIAVDVGTLRRLARAVHGKIARVPLTPASVTRVLRPYAVLHVGCRDVVAKCTAYLRGALCRTSGRLPQELNAPRLLHCFARLIVATEWLLDALARTVRADPTVPESVIRDLLVVNCRLPAARQQYILSLQRSNQALPETRRREGPSIDVDEAATTNGGGHDPPHRPSDA